MRQVLLILMVIVMSCSNRVDTKNLKSKRQTTNKRLLTKNELKELCSIAGNQSDSIILLDSMVGILYDHIYHPTIFDSVHKKFNYHLSPNLRNPHPTLDNWQAYEGDSIQWQTASVQFLLYEFRFIGAVDGIGGVVSTIQSSIHSGTFKFPPLSPSNNFDDYMSQINTELKRTDRNLVIIDGSVLIIKSKDLEKLERLCSTMNWTKLTTY